MKPKITIIIPVYNVERYLRKCLDSVVNQTLKEIEVICVNDCSPDNSRAILEEYAECDGRIKVINHTENSGLGGARNTGVDSADGEYIWFVDSDDFIELHACELLYNTIKREEADVLLFQAFSFTGEEEGKRLPLKTDADPYDRYTLPSAMVYSLFDHRHKEEFWKLWEINAYVSACMYLTKSTLAAEMRFAKGYFEDTDYTPVLLHKAHSVYAIHYAPYYRLIRQNSIMQSPITSDKIRDRRQRGLTILEYAQQANLEEQHPLVRFGRGVFLKDRTWVSRGAGNEEIEDQEHNYRRFRFRSDRAKWRFVGFPEIQIERLNHRKWEKFRKLSFRKKIIKVSTYPFRKVIKVMGRR